MAVPPAMRILVAFLLTLAGASAARAQAPTDACTMPSDCALTHATCCGACGSAQPGDAIAVRPERLRGLHPGCDPLASTCPACAAPDHPDLAATCTAGSCAVLELSSLPDEGTIDGCTITVGAAESWASSMLPPAPPVTDPSGLTPAGTAVHVRIVCRASARAGHLRLAGWITAGGETQRVDAPLAFDVPSGAASDLEVGPGRVLELRVHLSDQRFLPAGTPVRAALHWRGSSSAVDLAASPTVVRVAS